MTVSANEITLLSELRAQPRSRVVEGLVEGAAGRAEALGEHVDGHIVDDDGEQDPALVRGEDLLDRLDDRLQELPLLRRRPRASCRRPRRAATAPARAESPAPARPDA